MVNIASAERYLFGIPQYEQSILHAFIRILLCVSFIIADNKKYQFCVRYVMASFHNGNRPLIVVVD